MKAPSFEIQNRIIYKNGYLAPRVRCVSFNEAEYLTNEMHEVGITGTYEVARTIVQKMLE